MNVRIPLQTLAVASLLSLTLLGGSIESTQARAAHHTQKECEADGYLWFQDACADRWCPWNNGRYIAPGKVAETDAKGGVWMCDGFTGEMFYVPPPRKAPPSTVVVPSGGVMAQP